MLKELQLNSELKTVVNTSLDFRLGLPGYNSAFLDSRPLQGGVHNVVSTAGDNLEYDDGGRYLFKSVIPSIQDFSASLPFKQGVEVRTYVDYVAGTYKVVTGEVGHGAGVYNYGQFEGGTGFLYSEKDASYHDNQKFDPLLFLKNDVTYPLYIDFEGQALWGWSFNQSVLEPLSIRNVATLNSPHFPFEPHRIWGNIEMGNVDKNIDADMILSADVWKSEAPAPFLDAVEVVFKTGLPDTGYLIFDRAKIAPFVEADRVTGVTKNLSGGMSDFILELQMKSNDDNGGCYSDDNGGYVSSEELSYGCGFTYDNSIRGTDSIAFGGMTH